MNPVSIRALRNLLLLAPLAALLFAAPQACAQDPAPPASSPATPPPVAKPPQSDSRPPEPASKKAEDPDAALDRAVREAGNDRAALVRKLNQYLERFPDAPRKTAVYRALVESCEQLSDPNCALQNAELFIANRPDDSEMMLVAVNLLDKRGDGESLARAGGYLTRVLDRVEKTGASEKPPHVSEQDWQSQQNDLRLELYILRGKIEEKQKKPDEAVKDFAASYALRPNALAAQHLAQLAELQMDFSKAIQFYLDAFVLPENSPGGSVDRRLIRDNLANVWRELHASDAGLGEAILGAFDHVQPAAAAPRPRDLNRRARDVLSFTVRRLDGSPMPLPAERGKVVVLNFWATWSGPCRELEPLFADVAANFADRTDVLFLAVNTDEDEATVSAYVVEHRWKDQVVFADGLDDFLRIISVPTVIVLDHTGRLSYRINGYRPADFVNELTNAVDRASPASTRH